MSAGHEGQSNIRYSRRDFIKVVGATAVASAATSSLSVYLRPAPRMAAQQVPPDGRFGRMFRLPPFAGVDPGNRGQ